MSAGDYRLAIVGESRTQLNNTTLREWLRRAGFSVWSGWGTPGVPEDVWFGELFDPIPTGVSLLTLGDDVTAALTGYRLSTHKVRGTLLPRSGGGYLVATIRPEEVDISKGQDSLKPLLGNDARRATECPHPRVPSVRFLHDPNELPKGPGQGDLVSVDIEGANGKPNIVGVAWSEDEAFVFLWSEELREWLTRLFVTNPIVGHNMGYDVPELQEAGVTPPANWTDSINLACLYEPDLPKALQFQCLTHVPGSVAWKGLLSHEYGPDFEDNKIAVYRQMWAQALTDVGQPVPQTGSEVYARYNANDVCYTLALANQLTRKLTTQGRYRYYTEIMQPLQPILLEMGQQGIPVDTAKLAEHQANCAKWKGEARAKLVELGAKVSAEKATALGSQIEELELEREMLRQAKVRKFPKADELTKLRGQLKAANRFNPDSPVQLAAILYDHFGLPVIKTEKGGRSVKEAAIEDLKSRVTRGTAKPKGDKEHCLDILQAVVDYNHWTHWLDTFLNPPVEYRDGWNYVLTTYSQHRTSTGRLASGLDDSDMTKGVGRKRKAQLGNIPKELRDMFAPPPGYVCVGGDWNSFQLAIFLWFAERVERSGFHQALFDKIRAGQMDPHSYLAEIAEGEPEGSITKSDPRRQNCKQYTFGGLFGGSFRTLARKAGHTDTVGVKLERAHELAFRKQAWWADRMARVKKQHYIQTPLGWRRYWWSWNPKREEVTATEIQATEGDVFKWVKLQMAANKPASWKWLTDLYDFTGVYVPAVDAPDAQAWMRGHMEACIPFLDGVSFAADVRVGPHWGAVS